MKRPLLLAIGALAAAVAAAQTPTPTPAPQGEAPIDTSTVERILRGEEASESGEGFTYDAAGRRDPFRSLLNGRMREDLGQRPPGLRGMAVDEVRLLGILKVPEGYLAILEGTDKMSYLVQPGAVLWDGTVERIEPGQVVFKVQVADPKSLQPYREVIKTLQ
jgi:Tfp pilus assembly protein PilP